MFEKISIVSENTSNVIKITADESKVKNDSIKN